MGNGIRDGRVTVTMTAHATVCILTAMPEEAAPFLDRLEQPTALADAPKHLQVVCGSLHGERIAVITTGIGLVAAASAATWAITTLAPQLILSAGSCGGLARDINVGDIAVSDSTSYGTADATEFGYVRGQVPGQPVQFAADEALVTTARDIAADDANWHVATILSGDTFVTERNVADTRNAFPAAIATDMESCAIAQVCTAFAKRFASVRSVSDLCGPAAGQEFSIGIERAAQNSCDAVLTLLQQLLDFDRG